jgi:thiamine-monophosphate kinase
MRIDQVGEDELVRLLRPHLLTKGIEVGAGEDDTAVIRDGDRYTVVSCDAAVEGVHFDLGWMSPEDAGWRALALALGDLAAKGATPTYGVAMVALPGAWEVEAAVGLYRGMAELGRRIGMALVGGDTSATTGPAVLALTVIGSARSLPLARSAAQPGWSIGVTGPLGAAAVALRERRALLLEPLLDTGRRLNEAGLCCGDVSDGLIREMEKFAAYSGVGCDIDLASVPVAEGATAEDALSGGEEAELVGLGPEKSLRQLGLHIVGRTVAEPAVRVLDVSGRPLQVRDHGYRHFA